MQAKSDPDRDVMEQVGFPKLCEAVAVSVNSYSWLGKPEFRLPGATDNASPVFVSRSRPEASNRNLLAWLWVVMLLAMMPL